jgi:hypothetical protein
MEQYRVMAIMEANFRVKDNTGFDMAEYKQRRVLLEEQRRQEQLQRQQRAKPKPKLPEIKPFTMWNDSSSGVSMDRRHDDQKNHLYHLHELIADSVRMLALELVAVASKYQKFHRELL